MSSKKIKVGNLETTADLSVQGTVTIGTEVVDNVTFRKKFEANKTPGRHEFLTPGTFTWTVPEGVIKISALAIGSGGAGHYAWAERGGCGGGLAYANDIPVVAGETYTIVVGGERPPTTLGTRGPATSVGPFISATAGRDSGSYTSTDADRGTFFSGTVSAKGGGGGINLNSSAGGGGGAAGYSGNGGNGYSATTGQPPYNGSGGGGAGSGGYGSSTYGFGGAGGVGIKGEGTSGTWGTLTSQTAQPDNNGNSFYSDYRYAGAGGSGGEHGMSNNNAATTLHGRTMHNGEGGRYGGAGGGSGTSLSSNGNFNKGAQGAAVIAWSTTDYDISKG